MLIPTFFTFLVALSFFSRSQASHHLVKRRSHQLLRPRALTIGTWANRGCFTDAVGGRTLLGSYSLNAAGNTVESCVAACNAAGFYYAGLEFGKECFCGKYLQNNGVPAPLPDCSFPCPGNAPEQCGAGNRLSLYSKGGPPPTPPAPGVAQWEYNGCWSDVTAARSLPTRKTVAGGMTVEKCTAACQASGFTLAGVEFSSECWCSNAFANGPVQEPDADCNMACSGNAAEKCGGADRLNVYKFTTPPAPQWKSLGCVSDSVNARTLSVPMTVPGGVTTESCQKACSDAGYPLAGTEFSQECYCDTQFRNVGVAAPAGDCNMPCQGNAAETCGGPSRLNAYYLAGNTFTPPPPTVQTTNLPANWQYQYCLGEPNGGRVFPYQITYWTTNTVAGCLAQCQKFGFPAAGLQWSQECWCGDVSDIAAHGGTQAPEADCNMPCSGDSAHLCGGPLRNSYYKLNVAPFVWHKPANKGFYEFFVPGVVVPLLATVGINNKITFLEKSGPEGPSNSTGAYELDPSLIDSGDWTKAWRTMHVKTDVFCSASLVLPDKAGRQINTAGWSGQAEYGIRLYTPTGSPGVPSTTDWEEDVNVLKTQRPRWYASAVVLANGTVLLMGGEVVNSGPPQANLEIIPRIPGGDTTVFLDWLQRTGPNSLYPFLIVLPSRRVLAVYYNEARLLDPGTFATVSTLPNIPGAVNNPAGGRTYPNSGAAMLLPQIAPYTDPVQVLLCGGSTPTKDAIDNCVTIAPEVAGAQWTIERMPSKRVLVCMVNLPDGTYMIMNGATFGQGGFANAKNPNLTPVLYDPTLPVNQRFSILSSTIVARMYHSEATLLPDASVLISGSDPLDPNFPEEYRIERYVPPYLNSGLPRPAFTIPKTDWTYNLPYTITVTSGSTANLRVSLIGASSSTHGNTMGTRTLFPSVSCVGQVCTITAPPNSGVCPPGWFMLFVLDGPTPSHASWVRIGGDPAKLGNWPPGQGFTRPGV